MRSMLLVLGGMVAGAGGVGWVAAQPSKPMTTPTPGPAPAAAPAPQADPPPPPATANDVALGQRCIAARKEYENSLKALYEHYNKIGDKIRTQWVERELMGFHLMMKPSYNLDVKDVPPPTLQATVNVKEANELYKAAMAYKGKGVG